GQIRAALINNGMVSAAETGFGNDLSLLVNNMTNNATMQAEADAVLLINGITVTQGASGVIAANAGGEVLFTGSQTITGGRILGPGLLTRANSASLTLNDVSLEGDLDVGVVAGVFYNGAAFNCTGTITLNDSVNANNSHIQFNTDTTISGGGSIFLAGGGDDSQVFTDAGMTLTIAPGFTIEGSGQIQASVVNNGLIRAFPSANGDGRMRLLTNNKTNNAQIVADAGGIVEINGIILTQGPAGVLLADGGEIEFNGTQSVTGGTVRAINGGTIVRENSAATSFTDVVLDGDMDIGVVAALYYYGATFQNNGVIAVNDSVSSNDGLVEFVTDCTLTGPGSIFLAGSNNDSQLRTNAGVSLTIDTGHTVEGSGEIHASLVNNGLIRAFPSANGDGQLYLFTNNKTNNAQIVADTGGVVEINGITITQGPAGVLLADGGEIEFFGTQSVTGGTVRAVNGGTIVRESSGNTTFTDVVLDGDMDIGVVATLFYYGATFQNNGVIAVNDSVSSNDGFVQFNTDCTLTGPGSIFLAGSNNDSQLLTDAGVTLTIDAGHTVEGSGEIHASLVNNGLIRAFPSPNGNGELFLRTNNKTNNAQIVADAGGIVELNGITLTQSPAGVLLADGGEIEFMGTQTVNGGTIRAINGGTLVRETNGSLNLSDITLDGDLHVMPISSLFYNSDTFTNNGAVLLNNTASGNDSIMQFNVNCTVTGAGRIVLAGGDNDSQMHTAAGMTATIDTDQSVEGEGQMFGTYVVNGTIAPGLPVGTITGSPNITLGDTAVFEADTDANNSGDRLNFSSGTLNADGDVRVSLVGGYIPLVNDQFNIITTGTVNGLFDGVSIAGGILPANLDVRLVYTPTAVDVKFVCISDLAPPFGVLDLADVNGFVSAFLAQDPLADIAEPIGVFDLADINTFIQNFLSGCN
ncbi:MAG: hypothetical protein K8E66_10825, partial [Phycisphaerales bacterium]|nr:hypothetical protein [Phycisphaerales bacterium]